MLIERKLPARAVPVQRGVLQLRHLAMMVISNLLVALVIPGGLVAFALYVNQLQWGVLALSAAPLALKIVLSVLIFDLAIWAQHLASHRIDFLWRLHRVHHSDQHLDASSALRFHPFEIALSVLYKAALIVLLGTPWQAVLIFEIILNSSALFNHANIRVHPTLERGLRWLLVTPAMHRWHHVQLESWQHSQYGSFLSIWDQLFGTLKDDGTDRASSPGLQGLSPVTRIRDLLALPFRR